MPVVTFPHMGESWRAFKMLLNDLGNEVIIPTKPNKQTLDYGVQNSPEFACLPLKILTGTYIEACNKGAEIIVTSGGSGPCRAGLYGQLHKKILNDLGYSVDVVVFDSLKLYPIDFLRKVKRLNAGRLSCLAVIECIKRAWEKLKYLDELEILTHSIRPRELEKGVTTNTYNKVLDWLDNARSIKEIRESGNSAIRELKCIPQNFQKDVLKVGIVGEIYVLLEPSCNLNIEENLGYLGVEVQRSIYLTDWTRHNTKRASKSNDVFKAASPYIPIAIGGHGRETVGHTVIYAQEGYDGVIQLAPFTCIPEIVAKTVLNSVSRIHDIPILTFFLDEQTGEAGMATRLEAFVDLIRRKKDKLDTYKLQLINPLRYSANRC